MILTLSIIFLLGYLLIIFEEKIAHDKSSIALTLGGLLWIVMASIHVQNDFVQHELLHHIEEIAGIIFFLMGAMTIVEIIDLNNGFDVVLENLTFRNKKYLLATICIISFFLSAFLDNLTTAIIMSSMSRKIFEDSKEKLLAAGLIIIAANAGGAWSPLGDVTTTMLWISNRISAFAVMKRLFIPSLVSTLIPFLILVRKFKGNVNFQASSTAQNIKERNFMFFTGVLMLILVPIIKIFTHLPPFVGMLFCVGLYWMISEILHIRKESEEKESKSIYRALEKLDIPSLLFFLGILLAVGALQTGGILTELAHVADKHIPNTFSFSILIGLISSIFDNVPILAAIQGMYGLEVYPTDHNFWLFLAYCVGTGGSMLVIGSAAGVAIMNSEKIEFVWYLKHISFPALLGFLGGAAVYLFFLV
jgi:Na+/H+ antiporter NhaD/arsenite permease-like protein